MLRCHSHTSFLSVDINLSNTVFALLWFLVRDEKYDWRLQQNPHFYLASPSHLEDDAELLPLHHEEKLETQLLRGSRTLYAVRDRAGYIFQTVGTPQTYGNIWEIKGHMVLRGTGCQITYTFPDDMCHAQIPVGSSYGRSRSQSHCRISTLNLNTGNLLRPNGYRIPTKT